MSTDTLVDDRTDGLNAKQVKEDPLDMKTPPLSNVNHTRNNSVVKKFSFDSFPFVIDFHLSNFTRY